MEINELILEYTKVMVSWPIVLLIVSLIFLLNFKESIKIFLENIASIKVGPFEASQRQVSIPEEKIEDQITENLQEHGIRLDKEQIQHIENAFSDLSKEKETKEQESERKDEIIKYLVERSELFEFSYLSLFLVHNSKNALLWFYYQISNSSTKENFIAQFVLPPQVINPYAEKEAIFNALMVNNLLEQNGVLFKVSEKGTKFLKHIKLIS